MTYPVPIGEPLPLYPVEKKCWECGAEWTGKAFTPQPAGAPRLPGTCAVCIAKGEEWMQALTARGPTEVGETLPELTRPRRSEEIE